VGKALSPERKPFLQNFMVQNSLCFEKINKFGCEISPKCERKLGHGPPCKGFFGKKISIFLV
jgi:hypothetical protein